MDDIERLLEKAAHYRRMMTGIDDKQARSVLEDLALEHEEKAAAMQRESAAEDQGDEPLDDE